MNGWGTRTIIGLFTVETIDSIQRRIPWSVNEIDISVPKTLSNEYLKYVIYNPVRGPIVHLDIEGERLIIKMQTSCPLCFVYGRIRPKKVIPLAGKQLSLKSRP